MLRVPCAPQPSAGMQDPSHQSRRRVLQSSCPPWCAARAPALEVHLSMRMRRPPCERCSARGASVLPRCSHWATGGSEEQVLRSRQQVQHCNAPVPTSRRSCARSTGCRSVQTLDKAFCGVNEIARPVWLIHPHRYSNIYDPSSERHSGSLPWTAVRVLPTCQHAKRTCTAPRALPTARSGHLAASRALSSGALRARGDV